MSDHLGWTWHGQSRPDWAETPAPGQRSVWDFPRPPSLEHEPRRVRVQADGHCLADSRRALRVCETASPPTVYVPPDDCDLTGLQAASGQSHCEWKGEATYLADRHGKVVAWQYMHPTPAFRPLAGWLCFYPGRVDCWLGDAPVRPQPGGFYGGWMTDDIVGPVKGEPGTGHW